MKKLLFAALMTAGLTSMIPTDGFAQNDTTVVKKHKTVISIGRHTGVYRDSVKTEESSKGRFIGGITFTRVDLGFSKLVDNGSFSLSPENDFLSYKAAKTSTFSFDVLQFGYRFNPNFKVYVAGGFDWTMIRLKRDITIQQDTRELTYIEEPIHFEKNRFSNSYVHIPLNFEIRSKENDKGKRFYVILGPEIGFLLNGKVKQVSDENGKVKYKDDYNFQPFRYGGTFRLGYGGLGIFTKYYLNDMFDSTAQKGLRNMSFGITFGLN